MACKRKIELLAPAGNVDSIKAAILAGADAVYCGLDRFNARNRAENIAITDLPVIIRLAHKNHCAVYLTLNIIIVESEIPALISLLNKLVNTKIDGLIVQDLGTIYLLNTYFPRLNIHASTQLTTHNRGQIHFLAELSATRVNLSRELNLKEIENLTVTAHENKILTEVFVHGSHCISFSGLCYFSSVHGGNSGNRGRCSQPCRDQYLPTARCKDFPLNLKDISSFSDLRELSEAGVDSVKIEGRIKKFHYVYTVVKSWRKQLESLSNHDVISSDSSELRKVFNRDFSNSFLKGDINKSMFIDNPRDNSATHLAEKNGGPTEENINNAKKALYDTRTDIINHVRHGINNLSIATAPLQIRVSGQAETPLQVHIKTPDTSFTICSSLNLVKTGVRKKVPGQTLNKDLFLERFKTFNDTEYFIKDLELEKSLHDLFLPFKELTLIKKKILFILNGEKEPAHPIETPRLTTQDKNAKSATLSLLISSENDFYLGNESSADIYFQLPNSLQSRSSEFTDLFLKNQRVTPWFPSVLIGEDYNAAVKLLQQLPLKHIVTNNSGIAYTAYKMGIPWIAGPYLNNVNSYSLLCLKEIFNCSGAFISNELKRIQIKSIKKPAYFKLYYKIFQPIVLLTSRQCLFHQVSGCKKNRIDDTCIKHCKKSATITNLKGNPLFIEKTEGNYHSIYNETHFLNTDILTDIPDLFTSFLIDLRDIHTKSVMEVNKSTIVTLFEDFLKGKPGSAEELQANIHPTSCVQYKKGI